MNGEPGTLNGEPGTLNGEPGTLNGEPGTLNGEPGTLNGEPGTLNGEPGTLNGEPGTLNGEPGTLNGEPGTLNPKPFTEEMTMQIKLFTIPIGDSGAAVEEMNRFLRGNKILEVENHLISNEHGAYWCFCVRYIERAFISTSPFKPKVDYKEVLDEPTFQKFSKLREIRKKVAADEGIPAYAVFTDEELAGLAKLETITEQTMLSVKGIGDKKVERYAKHFLTKSVPDEKTGTFNFENS